MSTGSRDDLVAFRRELHRHPEPAWREFYTTARIVEELRERDVAVTYGRELIDPGGRLDGPDESELADWRGRALDAGADPDVVAGMDGGFTGAVAVLERGEGPVVALRVDIDALPVAESDDPGHAPAEGGFRSAHEGYMHACGHDAHATIGLGVLDAVLDSEFAGAFKLLFQPAEERVAGGGPLAESGVVDDADRLFALHVGLDHPTGRVVAGIDGFLAVRQFHAAFEGEPAHAGAHPEDGRNAIQALGTAIGNLYAIPRHADGETRVNAGIVGGGTATNVIPASAHVEGEVRGGTTELGEYMYDRAERALETAAAAHGCEVEVTLTGEAPSATSDAELIALVADVAAGVEGVEEVRERDELGGSEDATYLMRRVQERGGLATYVGIGTDHPGGHHTGTFDVDERSIGIGVEVLSRAVVAAGERR